MAKKKNKPRRKREIRRSPIPRQERDYTPDDVLLELREVTALVLTGLDKFGDNQADLEAKHQLDVTYQALRTCDIYQIVPDMVDQIRQVFNVKRNGQPKLNAGMMPSKAGYVFFDKLWQIPIQGSRTIRSVSWAYTKTVTSNLGMVDSIQVNVYGPHYSSIYADLLPLGEQYEDTWRGYKSKGMQQLGHVIWSVWMMLNSELAAEHRTRVQQPVDTPPRLRNIEQQRYRVVYLRRRQDGEHEVVHRNVQWQGRFTVDEHWRHLGKYEGPRHKAVPEAHEDHYICVTCRAKGDIIKITHVKACGEKPKGRSDLPWLVHKQTVHKLVR